MAMGLTKQQKNLKKNIEKRMFAQRNELSDELKAPKKGTVTPDEIVEFLKLSAVSHVKFFHYTKMNCVAGFLKSRKLYLSRLSEMNDLNEYIKTPDANRIYIACFSYGSIENMAMWRMYGGLPSESVRLEFKGTDIVSAIGKKDGHKIYEVKEDNTCSDYEIPLDEVEWSFHDVAYKYGNALYWNHNVIGIGRCQALQNVFGVSEFAGYVKNYGWMSENEVRLMIKLRRPILGLKRIAVDFGDPIDNMTALAGPKKSKEILLRRMFEDYSYNPEGKVYSSKYMVDFK